jgi:nicotinamidase-related amidase
MNTALLIVDVQQALTRGEYAAFESMRVIDRINAVLRVARRADAPVVLIQHEERAGPFEHGTAGWTLDPALEVLPTDVRVRKTTPDSFHDTDLKAVLDANGVTEVVVCGFQSEFCVDSTTRRALALRLPVTLVEDAHSTLDNGVLDAARITAHHNRTLASIDSYGTRATLVPASDVRFER